MTRGPHGVLLPLALGLLVAPLAAEAQPAATPREQLLGTWQLVSHPSLTDAVGRLLSAADGQMCVTLMRPDRQTFSTASPLGGSTAAERAAAAAGYFNYGGSYQVNGEKGLVTERVELSLFPNWVGTAQVTFISVSGHQLTRRGGVRQRLGAPTMRRRTGMVARKTTTALGLTVPPTPFSQTDEVSRSAAMPDAATAGFILQNQSFKSVEVIHGYTKCWCIRGSCPRMWTVYLATSW